MTANLTPKQREVLQLVAGHLTSKEIARQTGISPSAANQRIAAACRRLGLRNRREAARFYLGSLVEAHPEPESGNGGEALSLICSARVDVIISS